jgi:hypothetical protein
MLLRPGADPPERMPMEIARYAVNSASARHASSGKPAVAELALRCCGTRLLD